MELMYIETIITIFHMFKKVEKRLNMSIRDMEDTKKGPNKTSKDENYNV